MVTNFLQNTSIVKQWTAISELGMPENPNQIEKFRIVLCNTISMLIILVCVLYTTLFLCQNKTIEVIPYVLSLFISIICLYLNHRKHFFANRLLIMLLANSLIFYTLIYAGYDIQSQMFFIILMATSFLLFRNSYIPFSFLIMVSIIHVIVYTYVLQNGPINAGSRIYIGEYINFIIALATAANLSHSLYEELKIYEKRNTDALEEIRQSNIQLQNKNEQLENLIYVTSHDLQEPLRNIRNMANLVVQTVKNDDEQTKQSIQFLNDSTDRMSNMIESIMKYAKIGHEQAPEWVDVDALLHEVKLDLGLQIKETNTVIEYEKIPKILAYRSELRSLIQNLLSNAIKFRHADRNPIIKISYEKSEDCYTFGVVDNGIGVDKKHSDTIFQMFKRLHTQRKYNGTGIGLAHCKKVVELHEGDIWVESNKPNGSIFYFTIKRYEEGKFNNVDR
ncbi:MAG: ATP-binding protein [Chitinophagales bacterium]